VLKHVDDQHLGDGEREHGAFALHFLVIAVQFKDQRFVNSKHISKSKSRNQGVHGGDGGDQGTSMDRQRRQGGKGEQNHIENKNRKTFLRWLLEKEIDVGGKMETWFSPRSLPSVPSTSMTRVFSGLPTESQSPVGGRRRGETGE